MHSCSPPIIKIQPHSQKQTWGRRTLICSPTNPFLQKKPQLGLGYAFDTLFMALFSLAQAAETVKTEADTLFPGAGVGHVSVRWVWCLARAIKAQSCLSRQISVAVRQETFF